MNHREETEHMPQQTSSLQKAPGDEPSTNYPLLKMVGNDNICWLELVDLLEIVGTWLKFWLEIKSKMWNSSAKMLTTKHL